MGQTHPSSARLTGQLLRALGTRFPTGGTLSIYGPLAAPIAMLIGAVINPIREISIGKSIGAWLLQERRYCKQRWVWPGMTTKKQILAVASILALAALIFGLRSCGEESAPSAPEVTTTPTLSAKPLPKK